MSRFAVMAKRYFLSAIAALWQKGANEQFYVLGRRKESTS